MHPISILTFECNLIIKLQFVNHPFHRTLTSRSLQHSKGELFTFANQTVFNCITFFSPFTTTYQLAQYYRCTAHHGQTTAPEAKKCSKRDTFK